MNKVERVKAVMNNEIPDKIPAGFLVSLQVRLYSGRNGRGTFKAIQRNRYGYYKNYAGLYVSN